MTKIDGKILELLEYNLKLTPQGEWKITEEMRVLIHEISEECNGMEIVQRAMEDKEEWLEYATPEEVYIHMLKKIVEAPTRIENAQVKKQEEIKTELEIRRKPERV